MPRPKRTEEEIAAMRQRILDAAVAILHKAGPGSLSIRAIAERVGVSHMVLYSYFENRDELFAALREHLPRQRYVGNLHAERLGRPPRHGALSRLTAPCALGHRRDARRQRLRGPGVQCRLGCLAPTKAQQVAAWLPYRSQKRPLALAVGVFSLASQGGRFSARPKSN